MPRGLIAVDKKGGKVIFLDPETLETSLVLDGFEPVPHELLVLPDRDLALVPIFGDGIHGRNPHPGHLLSLIDLERRCHVGDIDLSPLRSPHGLQRGPDGLIYVTCENSGVVALVDLDRRRVVDTIETGSTNAHRLAMAPGGGFLYTENEEDASISVLDLATRRRVRQIEMPHALAGLAVSPDGKVLVAVDDTEPALFLIDAATADITRTVVLHDVPHAAQIARYGPDGTLMVTSLQSGTVTLIGAEWDEQTTIAVGRQPMDGAFQGRRLLVACQGDGSIHTIDLSLRRNIGHVPAGVGCETLAFF